MLTYSQDSKREGMRQYSDGHYSEAAGAFRNALHQVPNDPEAEYWLGMSYEASKDYHRSIDAYKASLKMMPVAGSSRFDSTLHDTVFDHLAHVVASVDSTNSEIDLIEKSASDEKSSEEYRLLGRILRYRGDADSALDAYRRSIRLDAANFVAQKELGIYLEQLSQNTEAGQVLRDAYRLNPQDKDVDAALRKIGMVPGPGLLAQDQLAKPLLPNGPIPDIGNPTPASHVTTPVAGDQQPRD